jgi:hypothetical protein
MKFVTLISVFVLAVLALAGWTRKVPVRVENDVVLPAQPYASRPFIMIGNWKDNQAVKSDSGVYVVRVKTDGKIAGWAKSDLTGQVGPMTGEFGKYAMHKSSGDSLTLTIDFPTHGRTPAYREEISTAIYFSFGWDLSDCSLSYRSSKTNGSGLGHISAFKYLTYKDEGKFERDFGSINKSNASKILKHAERLTADLRKSTFPFEL